MARSHSHITGAGPYPPLRLGAGGGSLAVATLAATVAVVTPIALWTRYGNESPAGGVGIAFGATLLAWGVVRLVHAPRPTERSAAQPSAQAQAQAQVRLCDAEARRTRRPPRPAAGRMRAGSVATTYRARPRRPARSSRDVGCRVASRRAARRRTRP